MTCGATHGLQLILGTLLSPNGVIFVEEVTYMFALDAFKQFPLMKIVMGNYFEYYFITYAALGKCKSK